MIKAEIAVGVVVALLAGALLLHTIFQSAAHSVNKRHCIESLGGVPVRDATNGNVVCLKKETLLKSYT